MLKVCCVHKMFYGQNSLVWREVVKEKKYINYKVYAQHDEGIFDESLSIMPSAVAVDESQSTVLYSRIGRIMEHKSILSGTTIWNFAETRLINHKSLKNHKNYVNLWSLPRLFWIYFNNSSYYSCLWRLFLSPYYYLINYKIKNKYISNNICFTFFHK